MRDKSAGSSPDNNNFITSIKIRLRNPMERYTDKEGLAASNSSYSY